MVVKHGDFEELYRRHLEAIVRYAHRRADATDAIDVVAETFAVAWRRFDDVPREPESLPWLYGISRNVLANQRRGQLRRHALNGRLRDEWLPSPNSGVELSTELIQLQDALGALSENDREVLQLAGFEELSAQEIAVVSSVSPEVVRNRLSRARSRRPSWLIALRESRSASSGSQTSRYHPRAHSSSNPFPVGLAFPVWPRFPKPRPSTTQVWFPRRSFSGRWDLKGPVPLAVVAAVVEASRR